MKLKSILVAVNARLQSSGIPAFATILMIGLATITTNCADPDLWGHVQYGREVLDDGVLPRTATWTYAAKGAPWVNHENIAELLLAGTVDTFGPGGLPWMKLAIAASLLTLMILSARKSGAGWFSIGIVVTLVAANVQFHWHFRPQILSYLWLAAMLAVWQHAFRDLRFNENDDVSVDASSGRLKILWLLAPLMCIWANSHGGFAAGVAILCAFHGLICLRLIYAGGRKHSQIVIRLSLITVVSVLATLLNPYGLGLWKFMLAALRLPRPEIADWGPLDLWSQEAVRFWCLIAAVLLSLTMDRARRDLTQLVIMGLLLWQGVSHCRHLSIFAIVCGFWIPKHLHAVVISSLQALKRLQPNRLEQAPGVVSFVACLALLIGSGFRLAPMLGEVTVNREDFPVNAMQYLHEQGLQGKILVTFNWAQYAIGCFAASDGPLRHSEVAVDGRFETCYPREITDICFDFWLGTDDPTQRYRSPAAPPFDPARALTLEQPDLVLLCRNQRPSVRVTEQHQDEWILLYQDSLAQVWGRRSKYANPESPFFVPESCRSITESAQQGTVAWPAFPTGARAPERVRVSLAAP